MREADGYVSVKDRLLAWWHGAASPTWPADNDQSLHIETFSDPAAGREPWTEKRARLNEALWGTGFVLPGDHKFASHLMSPVLVNPKQTILDVAPGMCGTALQFAKQKNVWIEAIESDASMAQIAQLHLARQDFGHHIDLRFEDFDTLHLDPHRYHVIYGREHLYAFESKADIVQQFCRGLRDNGQLMLIDYVCKDGAEDDPLIREWRELERRPISLWTEARYASELKSSGMTIRMCDNFSVSIFQAIKAGFHRMLEGLETGAVKREDIDNIMHEGRVWQNRMRALQSGTVQLVRIDARKQIL